MWSPHWQWRLPAHLQHLVAGWFQPSPPPMGQGLKCTPLHKRKPRTNATPAQHARKTQYENGPPSIHPNTTSPQHKESHQSGQCLLQHRPTECDSQMWHRRWVTSSKNEPLSHCNTDRHLCTKNQNNTQTKFQTSELDRTGKNFERESC